METVRQVLKQIPSLEHIDLYGWGEPLLNKKLPEIISELTSDPHKLTVTIHSNLSLEKEVQYFEQLVRSKLTTLSVSCDGASQETYEKYRVGGSFDLVLRNMRTLVDIKRQLNTPLPHIRWKMLITKHNEHEVPEVKRMAKEIGVGLFLDRIDVHDDPDQEFPGTLASRKQEWLPSNTQFVKIHKTEREKEPINNYPCHQLFERPMIGPTGEVYPCCHVTQPQHSFGNILQNDFSTIWNNSSFLSARQWFFPSFKNGTIEDLPCVDCKLFKKRK